MSTKMRLYGFQVLSFVSSDERIKKKDETYEFKNSVLQLRNAGGPIEFPRLRSMGAGGRVMNVEWVWGKG